MDHPIEHFCCQNPDCRDRGVRGQGNLLFCGWSGEGKRIRMIYCRTCKARFSERKGTVLSQSRLADEKAVSLLEHIRDGCGTRATARLLGVDKNTVTRYIKLAGAHAQPLHDEFVAFSPSDAGGAVRREMELRRQETRPL
jgi:LacI family transcriptional regulator